MDASNYVDEKRKTEIEVVGPKESYDGRPHVQIQLRVVQQDNRYDMFYLSLFGEDAIWTFSGSMEKALETIQQRMETWGEGGEKDDLETITKAGEGNSVALTE